MRLIRSSEGLMNWRAAMLMLPEEQLVTGRAGTVVVMNTHMWHAGTGNHTDRCRRALHGFYTRADKPQRLVQGLSIAIRRGCWLP